MHRKRFSCLQNTVRCDRSRSRPVYLLAALLALFAAGSTLYAQETSASADVTVEQIVSMSQAGISDSVILALLHKQNRPFDLTPERIIQLKGEKVSEAVIQAMLDPHYASPPAQALAVTATISPYSNPSGITIPVGGKVSGDPNDPINPHDSGIYLFSQGKMNELERTSYQALKVTGSWAEIITYGFAPTRIKAEVPGAHAGIQAEDPSPVFYFYFEDKPAGLGKSRLINLSTPAQFVLLKMRIVKNQREVKVGSVAIYGSSFGTDLKSQIAFKSERLETGLYKVTVEGPLRPGEYCFLASSANAGAAMPTDIYDFGIKKSSH